MDTDMITDLELIGSPARGSVAAKSVKCWRLKLGGQTLGLLGDEHNRMLAICAEELTPELALWIEGRDLREPYVESETLAGVLGVGFAFVSVRAEAWILGNSRLRSDLAVVVGLVVMGGAS